ncbi:guanine-1-methyltransferase-domain-containing protein [Terfezia claveryi]|nr:guanine-1-methyltransferase-domain-containing protein [Terfezia claveryi]
MADSMDMTSTVHAELENGNMKQQDTTMNGVSNEPTEAPTKSGSSGNTPSKSSGQLQEASELQLSKNALKRLRRQQAWEEHKKERKLRDKLKKKQKKEEERRAREEESKAKPGQKRKAGGEEGDAVGTEDLQNGAIVKKQKKTPTLVPITVIIDCGFDDLMHEKEVTSLSSQLTRSYSDNRNAPYQVQLSVTSLNKRLKHRMETTLKNHHKNWKRVKFCENDYEVTQENKDSLIYLSSDSDYTLEGLEEGKTYIVGGIVDRNRHKGICHRKATEQGIKTAKLPIGDYIRMASRVVLTTNQVVEIMLKWLECRDWQEAFLQVIPQRKAPEARNEADTNTKAGEGDEGEEEEEEDDGHEGYSEAGEGQGEDRAEQSDAVIKDTEAKPTKSESVADNDEGCIGRGD